MGFSLDKLKVNVNVIKPAKPVNTTFFEFIKLKLQSKIKPFIQVIGSCHVKYGLLSMFDIILLNSSMWTVDIPLTASFVESKDCYVVFGDAISMHILTLTIALTLNVLSFKFKFSSVWLFLIKLQQTSYIYVLPTIVENSWTVRTKDTFQPWPTYFLLKIQRNSRYFHQISQQCFWVVDELLTLTFLLNFTSYFCMYQIVWLEKKNWNRNENFICH